MTKNISDILKKNEKLDFSSLFTWYFYNKFFTFPKLTMKFSDKCLNDVLNYPPQCSGGGDIFP